MAIDPWDITVLSLSGLFIIAAAVSPFLVTRKRLQYLCTFAFLFAAGLLSNLAITFRRPTDRGLPKYDNPVVSGIQAASLILPILLGTSAYVISTSYKILTVRLMAIPFLAGASQAFILIQTVPYSYTLALVMFFAIPAANVISVSLKSPTGKFSIGASLAIVGSAIDIYFSQFPIYMAFLLPPVVASTASLMVLQFEGGLEVLFASILGCACINPDFLIAVIVCCLVLTLFMIRKVPGRNKFRYSLLAVLTAVAATARLDGIGSHQAVAVIGRELSLGLVIMLILTALLSAEEKFGPLAVLCTFMTVKHAVLHVYSKPELPLSWISLGILGGSVLCGVMVRWKYRFMLLLAGLLVSTAFHSYQQSSASAQMVIALTASCLGLSSSSKSEFFSLLSVTALVTTNLLLSDPYRVRSTTLNTTTPSLALGLGLMAFIATEKKISDSHAVMDEAEFEQKMAETVDP